MGRTNPTYRDLIGVIESDWTAYRRVLRPADRPRFDRLFQHARNHADAAGQLNHESPIVPLVVSIQLAHERRLDAQADRLDAQTDRLDAQADRLDAISSRLDGCSEASPDTEQRANGTLEATNSSDDSSDSDGASGDDASDIDGASDDGASGDGASGHDANDDGATDDTSASDSDDADGDENSTGGTRGAADDRLLDRWPVPPGLPEWGP